MITGGVLSEPLISVTSGEDTNLGPLVLYSTCPEMILGPFAPSGICTV